jgi:hypothetical protein
MIALGLQFGKALLGSKPFLYALGVLGAVVSWNLWIGAHDSRVTERALTKVDSQAKELTTEAVKAREPASEPGSAERQKRVWCRDCKP